MPVKKKFEFIAIFFKIILNRGNFTWRFKMNFRAFFWVTILFAAITSLASDSLYIYICDWYNHRIVRIEDMFGTGWTEFGTHGTGVGEFDGPCWLVPADDGKLYIADRGNSRIVRIDDMTGAGWTELDGFDWPRTIEQDVDGRFFIADDHAHNIVRIDDITGAGWTVLGGYGTGIGQFNRPAHVIPNSGKMFVCDAYNNRVVRCDNMTTAGWITYGTAGSGVGQFGYVLTATFDADDRIYLTDCTNNRIVRIDGISGAGWTEYGSSGSGMGHFTHVNHVAIDDSGRLYVSDAYNHRIVRIDDMTGAGWIEFGSHGSGVGEFNGQTHIRLVKRTPDNIRETDRTPSAVSISAFPNPFNSAVTIAIDCRGLINQTPTVEIFDVNGRMVEDGTVGAYCIRPFDGSTRLTPTTQEYIWSPHESLPSGVYLVRATFGDEYSAKPVVYIK